MPDLPSPRKPPRRFWLYAPYGLFLALAFVWSLAWLVVRGQAVERLDQTAARLRSQGWTVIWSDRRLDGYPFRLHLRLDAPQIREPSGWAIAAPALEAEAYAYAPDHWVVVAPSGVSLTRPGAGTVDLAGQGLRASLSPAPAGGALPQIAVQGWKLAATALPDSRPLPVAQADKFAFYLRDLPGDQAEFQLQLEGAIAQPGGVLEQISGKQPLALVWDETFDHASALRGPAWPVAVRAWSRAGGGLSLTHGEIDSGEVTMTARSGRLQVDEAGYLAGDFNLDLRHARAAPQRMGAELGMAALAGGDLSLGGGKARLGPFVIGKAPKVY